MKTKIKVAIITGTLSIIGMVLTALVSEKFGEQKIMRQINSQLITVNGDGNTVTVNNVDEFIKDYNKLTSENKSLVSQNATYYDELVETKNKIKEYESHSSSKIQELEQQINEMPDVQYKDLGLSIDGENRNINKSKSSVIINGNQYFSQDFVDNLLPDDKTTTIKNNTLYIGKIIKNKCDLIDQQIVGQTQNAFIENNVKDTYGKIHNKAVVFAFLNDKITFCANREYSNLKFKIAVKDGKKGGGIIQISSDKGDIFTTEEEITYLYEPIEIDRSINQASTITIECISDNSDPCIMITDAVLYNEE